uniref:2'-phosphotransferase n=1 Tax=Plectus sambesii TaxID=2011161 RepID=A0A914VXW7_9BILA
MADVKLSKTLSFILRHGANKVGVTMDSEGFVPVNELLALPQLRSYKLQDVHRVVEDNSKQRFLLKEDCQRGLLIRANQGHSLDVANLDLTPITRAADYPTVVHENGTESYSFCIRDSWRRWRHFWNEENLQRTDFY